MKFIKIHFGSKDNPNVKSDVFIPVENIKSISHDFGVAKKEDGTETQIERLTITTHSIIEVDVPKTGKDGQALMTSRGKVMTHKESRNEMFFVEGGEIKNVLAQL